MKRTLFFIVLIVMMFGLSAQNYMLIYKTDGSIVRHNTAEIDSIKFVPMGNFEEPTVTTNEVENITFTSAICGGNVTYDGGVEVTAKGICWSTEPNPTVSDNYTVDGSGIGSYTSNLSNLLESTTYYVRAYATNVVGTSYGEERSFTTLEGIELPAVITSDITEVTHNSAVSGGNVTDDGGSEVTARGVCWSTNQNPTIEDNKTTDGAGLGIFTSNLTNLESNATYYVRAYAINEAGVSYGEEKSFTTMKEKKLPVVTTKDVEEITTESAVGGGEVTDDGNCEVTARGVCWSTKQNPTTEDNKTTDGAGLGSFTSNLTNLEENTTYYVRAYATNEAGTAYGEELTFTTLKGIELPAVVTSDITEVTHNSAVSGGNVTDDGGAEVTARGVCWSTNQNPTIEDNKTTDGAGLGSYTSNLTNLESNTTYYVRAYAINEAGTAYGSIYVLETEKETTGTVNGHEWIDLGLPSGLKWATCNVGADNPEDYGNYYAWGETATKSEYADSNSLTYELSISELQAQGIIDGNSNLTPQYDAATANWGGTWRMPTRDEQEELLNNCTWEWTTQNGVNGCKVTGTNGNSIFLPAAGYRSGSSRYFSGSRGNYWSSTPYNSNYAYDLYIYSSGQNMNYFSRYSGRSVRPVSE